jgi:hypothetical protein
VILFFFLVSFGSSGKFTKEEPACNGLPFDDRRFTMTQATAAFTTLLIAAPMIYEGASLCCIQQSIMCKIRLFVVNRRGSNESSAHSIYGAQILSFSHFFGSDN